MIENNPSDQTRHEGPHSPEKTPEKRVEPAPTPTVVPAGQLPVPPAKVPEQLGSHTGTECDETQQKCPHEVAVRIKKEPGLSAFEKHTLTLNWITLFVLILTFAVFFLQLRESRTQTGVFVGQANQAKVDAAKQLTAASEALTKEENRFVQDQRPYLWYSTVDQPKMVADKPIFWSYHYSNYGRSPAIGVKGREQVIWGPNAEKQVMKDLFFPLHIGAEETGTILPNGKDEYTTAHSMKNAPNAEDIKYITEHDRGVKMISYWEYFDVHGNKYFSTICIQRLASGAIANCGEKYTRLK